MNAEAGEETVLIGVGAGEVFQIEEGRPDRRGATDFAITRVPRGEKQGDEPQKQGAETMPTQKEVEDAERHKC